MTALPIDALLPAIQDALAREGGLVVRAPPGAGKTTRIPLALLGETWLAGRRIVMLEPRRLAARLAAARMAAMLGEDVGGTVGYRIRFDSRIGARTRIEVVTEGVLTRMLRDDPSLAAFGLAIFDEFHERSLHADLGLALALESRAALRPDLRLLVMSATLATAPVAKLLGGAPIVAAEGRAWPVETRWLGRPSARLEDAVARAVRKALADEPGDILVFLPGAAEIRRVESALRDNHARAGIRVLPLLGELPQAEQERALRPSAAGERKVVLATAIAETSLTIEGVRVVIDGGLMRRARFDAASGMGRLVTVPVSRAAADQRRGRAGRLGPGVCYRLWSEAEDRALVPDTPPEILDADLAPLALDLAVWGTADPNELSWLDPPPQAAWREARGLLVRLGALDDGGRLTDHGRAMAALALHPRLAHMIARARDLGMAGLACDLAALLGERDLFRSRDKARDTDIRHRLAALRGGERPPPGLEIDRGALQRARAAAGEWRRRLKIEADGSDPDAAGLLIALAYPDRIARRRETGKLAYLLANGKGAAFGGPDPLAKEEWLALAEVGGGGGAEGRIFLAAPLTLAEIEEHFADQIRDQDDVRWDDRAETVVARRARRLGALVLEERPLADDASDAVRAAMIDGVRRMGLDVLPWTPETRALCRRVAFMAGLEEADAWPGMNEAALLADIEHWLAPYLGGMTRRAQLAKLDLDGALKARIGWERLKRLDIEAPTHMTVPSGSRVPLDYSGEAPALDVRIQEMFGLADTPRVAGGRVPVLLRLLSPARRPVQVTRDLAGFWANSYRAVRADLRGRYPKHPWPDDPLAAPPTARAKPRSKPSSRT
ncbi:MAG: ATP-dependent helicase HrpB [Rhodospirillales bacterium]|nr:ATP-dependent helicase HrpB [Rhodospirillales bacterium]